MNDTARSGMRHPIIIIFAISIFAGCSDSSTGSNLGHDDDGPDSDAERVEDMNSTDDASSATSDLGADSYLDASSDLGASDMRGDAAKEEDTGDDVGTDAGMSRFRGTCMDSQDCGGEACVAIPDDPAGYHTCDTTFADPMRCVQDGMLFPQDECCKHDECTDEPSGQCITTPIFFCGGALPPSYNTCFYHGCTTDADCTGGDADSMPTCVPAGAFQEPVARCTFGDCQFDSDCDRRAGGQCTAFFSDCAERFRGFWCTYNDSTCRTDSDCPPPDEPIATSVCKPDDGHGNTRCDEVLPRL